MPNEDLPNLRDLYGPHYLGLDLDPCADSWRDPTYHILRTRTGCVFPYSHEFAGVEVSPRFATVTRQLGEAGYRISQDASDVRVFLVPWTNLDDVLPIVGVRKRPQRRAAEGSVQTASNYRPDEAPGRPEGESRLTPRLHTPRGSREARELIGLPQRKVQLSEEERQRRRERMAEVRAKRKASDYKGHDGAQRG